MSNSWSSRSDNYPDDIRNYDNDPRSPFYQDLCEEAEVDDIEDLDELYAMSANIEMALENAKGTKAYRLRELAELVDDRIINLELDNVEEYERNNNG